MSARMFRDRREAGRVLAGLLDRYRGSDDVVVLGLPRGGVPVAFEVAQGIGAPLDVFLVRKLGVPGRPELAMGAIASGGVVVINDDVVRGLAIAPDVLRQVAEQEGRELVRREFAYRDGLPMADLAGRTVILVDDGLATGASMRAAIQALRQPRAGPGGRLGARRTAVDLRGVATRGGRRGVRHHAVAVLRRRCARTGTSRRPPTRRCATFSRRPRRLGRRPPRRARRRCRSSARRPLRSSEGCRPTRRCSTWSATPGSC